VQTDLDNALRSPGAPGWARRRFSSIFPPFDGEVTPRKQMAGKSSVF